MKSIGLFFGAGAEVGYGLPSGGKFAIELFRQDSGEAKLQLRKELQSLNRSDVYATKWLPSQFWTKNIHAFGKTEFGTLIESSIDNKRSELTFRLGQFDTLVEKALTKLNINQTQIVNAYRAQFGKDFGTSKYTQLIKLNELLGDKNQLFDSEYYSAILDFVKSNPQSSTLRRYAVSFLQLLVGSCGQDLVNRLNQELFSQAPDDLAIFDDVSSLFKVEFSRGGLDAIDLLINERLSHNTNVGASLDDLLCAISQEILESIFDGILDYQALIDSHFRYLYCPATDWAKFTKMVVFMRQARTYISSQIPSQLTFPNGGYYHDLPRANDYGITINTIGTSNYNSLLEKVAQHEGFALPNVLALNGGVIDFYNPYTNSVTSFSDVTQVPKDQIHVPFFLTQSGLKPLTSVNMSRRYVDLYDNLKECNALSVVGFGFNRDDSHINGLFRKLIAEDNKTLFWVRPSNNSIEDSRRELLEKLRLSSTCKDKIIPILVDKENRTCQQVLWLKVIADNLLESESIVSTNSKMVKEQHICINQTQS